VESEHRIDHLVWCIFASMQRTITRSRWAISMNDRPVEVQYH
jgi:hypothetical protein